MNSIAETILARVLVALTGATGAGSRVYRARDDAFGPDDVKALNIRRASTSAEVVLGRNEALTIEWEIDCHVRGGEVETAADELHMQAHAALMADSTLAGLGRGLRCTGTNLETESADTRAAKLTARYQMKAFVGTGDLTTQIN